ncbi:MAG: hypothetical protein ABFD97_15510 [Syntrophobacter sp.]
MQKVRCAHCGSRFVPNPRIKNQRYCGKLQCQRARKTSWQRQKLAADPDYQANKRDSQRAWMSRNLTYWQSWRARHPSYVERNRMGQENRGSRYKNRVAKMDALKQFSVIKTGSYYILPDSDELVAKMDASARKVRLILMT